MDKDEDHTDAAIFENLNFWSLRIYPNHCMWNIWSNMMVRKVVHKMI